MINNKRVLLIEDSIPFTIEGIICTTYLMDNTFCWHIELWNKELLTTPIYRKIEDYLSILNKEIDIRTYEIKK